MADHTISTILENNVAHKHQMSANNIPVGFDVDAEEYYTIAVDSDGLQAHRNYIWNTDTLAWEAATGSLGAGGAVEVTNFPATQAVSAVSLPLPTGAATETTLKSVAGFNIPQHDYISLSQNSTQDIWTYKTGGSGGTTVGTITVTFTSSAKTTISNVVKS